MKPRAQAVALSHADKGSAPKVVAKGYGATAEEIMQGARDAGVYVHGSAELVQLLMGVDLDRHIPPALYVAVAELLVWLHDTDRDASSSVPNPRKS